MRYFLAMSAVAAAGLAFMLSPLRAEAALAVGAKAPDFTTRGAKAGKLFRLRLSDALKKGPVVLYFFPAAFTKGCTAEAREFAKSGATVIGMANDPVDVLARFSKEECRDKFAVASAGPDIIKAYDVALPLMPGRSNRTSYVITGTGRIAYVYSALDYSQHVKNTLAAVQSLK
jgi:peroxiredoxin Q/BCP